MEAITFAAVSAAKRALERVVDDIYDLSKDQIRKRVTRWKTKKAIQTLYTKLKHIRQVKTIWQVEKEVDLAKFYCPSRVKSDSGRKVITDLDDFDYSGNLVVVGNVGQGKSIFLRYLTAREMSRGRCIPLFVELRRIGPNETLVGHLVQEMISLGLDADEDLLRFLANHGKVTLFLDAFDEVKEAKRELLVAELETMARRHEATRIIVSSRRNSGIEGSPFFRMVELSPLAGGEYEEVIARIAHNEKIAEDVIAKVKQAGHSVIGLLTTPLMVALLMVRFRASQSIPESTIAFYDDLFAVLLQRHDKLKAGYVRPRQSKLGDANLEKVFNALCFLMRKNDEADISQRTLYGRIGESLDVLGMAAKQDKVAADIIEITCLIVEEGGECRFVHKSVQEYHAASFIKEQPEASAKRFYTQVRSIYDAWSQELLFLEQLDRYRFCKYFLIPDIEAALEVDADSPLAQWKPTREVCFKFWEASGFLMEKCGDGYHQLPSAFCFASAWSWTTETHILQPLTNWLMDFTLEGDDMEAAISVVEPGEYKHYVYLSKLVAAGHCEGELYEACRPGLLSLHRTLWESREFVKKTEATEAVFDFGT